MFPGRPQPYIICYQLTAFFWNYNKLFEELKRSLNWCHYLDRTWIVIRTEELHELSELLIPFIYPHLNDRLLIMPARGPAAGMLPQEAWDWITTNIPN
jgi:hypothetical protein